MDDNDENKTRSPSRSPSRPPTAIVRKVPGSFDNEGISPFKESFDDQAHAQPATDTKTPKLKQENIPPLHPPAAANGPDSSYFESPSIDPGRHSDSQAELAVRQHLQDIESSFSAPLSPIPTSSNGVDDTFLFDSPSKKATPSPSQKPALAVVDEHEESQASPERASAPSTSAAAADNDESQPSMTTTNHDETNVSSNTSALEAFSPFSSSPTAAAAARTMPRTISAASAGSDQNKPKGDADEHRPAEPYLDESSIPSERLSAESGTLRHMSSDQSLNKGNTDAGSTPGFALRSGRRPKYLRSRGTSQRSSVSSFTTDNESDVTVGLGADYALQSGGALPTLSLSRSTSNILSRSISMGSMASGFDEMHDSTPAPLGARGLETLAESPRRTNGLHGDEDLLQTPKAKRNSTSLTAPTDTVIARHVRNVHVPESLAKEYKSKSGLITPRRPSEFSAASGTGTHTSRHGGKNLTLKEQSSTIERLSKENFDLKLKVMFLSDRLDKLSEEGVKEMISENVELKTGLAVLQRDNKVLRRRVKELEKQLKDDDERPGTAKSGVSDDDSAAYDQEAQEREEELIYLRERMEEYVTEVERLRNENLNKEAEKRRMAEALRSMGERTGEHFGRQEEVDVWRDLHEQEEARRLTADEENNRLKEEVRRLKEETHRLKQENTTLGGGLHHTTNIYNITKKPAHRSVSPTRPVSSFSNEIDANGGSMSNASTLVDELRRESEQLRHENAELRKDLGAQASMLTSRNKERERLTQEIEDLKMAQRRGGPAPSTVDSILERSASRAGAHERSQSRASGGTRITGMVQDDPEREELENQLAELRDRNNELKLEKQDLQRELKALEKDFETAAKARQNAEDLIAALQEDLDVAHNDMMQFQTERDEALLENEEVRAAFNDLQQEAQEEIIALEDQVDQQNADIERLKLDLNDRTENFKALQEEMRKMSEALVQIEDEQDNKARQIQQLEQDLADANKELEELEAKLLEANDKNNRLQVQQESSQSEITFLREEQESDKIRIGDLEAAIATAEQSLRDEKDRVRELDQRLATERKQREIVANREKEEVQQFVNELNREMSAAKDEAKRLRKNLTSREVEVAQSNARLTELENNLREALGDLNGTRSSILKSIAKLQQGLENTSRELDSTKASLMEKERIIKQRDALLESHSLESRKLAEQLEKERQAHRNTKHQYETFQKTHHHVTRTVTSQDGRIMELENAKAQDKRRIQQLEASFKEQLTERNNLLLQLWTRLSSLCGTDWAHDNSLINGRALPSLETVTTMLPGFSKNLLAAVKMIERMLSSFPGQIKDVEQNLWREYQTLESHLEERTKRLNRLETLVRNGVATGALGVGEAAARMARLEEAYRQLKVENHTLRTAAEVRARTTTTFSTPGENGGDVDALGLLGAGGGSPSPSVPTGPRDKSRSSRIPAQQRTSSSRGTTLAAPSRPTTSRAPPSSSHGGGHGLGPEELALAEPVEEGQTQQNPGADNKWMLRLRDLEYKMKAEREGRVMDRGEAQRRLKGYEEENARLREQLERERKRAAGR
ncbi:Anucleate primary sterigmata protein b [Coniochaeta hoffmannii]|uniref:Anucleate primary sterigmata protein b n=1 Tax=Coniochaeta hoffmannii TaxID=91930 RepID=A0AA38RXX9_9PEZI|nr:Anucleate primary sterigmata protein b [Coniochaeta hoffmannii]